MSSPPAEILATAQDAVESTITDARDSVERAWPKIRAALGNGIYHSAYGISFGISFPILLIAKTIPQNNSVVWGLVDGAKAARAQCDRQITR